MLQARTVQNLSADGLGDWQCDRFRLDETTLLRLVAVSLLLPPIALSAARLVGEVRARVHQQRIRDGILDFIGHNLVSLTLNLEWTANS
jgi:hypothetical protein